MLTYFFKKHLIIDYGASKKGISVFLQMFSFICYIGLIFTVSSPLILYKYFSLVPAIFAAGLGVSTFLITLFFEKKFAIHYLTFCFIFFTLIAIFGTLIYSHNFSYLKTTINVFLMFFSLILYFITIKRIKLFSFLFSFSILSLAYAFLIYYFPQILSNIRNISAFRFGNEFDNTNSLAFTFLTGIVCNFVLCIFYKENIGLLIYFYISIFILSISIFLTGSRAALLGLLISIITYLIVSLYKKHKIILSIILLFLIVIIVVVLLLPPFETIRKRFFSLFTFTSSDSKYDASLSIRLSMFVDSIQYWFKHLFFGYGDGGFASITNHGSYSHSTLAEMLCNFGLVGSFFYLFPLIYPMTKNRNVNNRNAFFILFFGVFLIGLIGTVLLQKKSFYILLAIFYSDFLIQNHRSLKFVNIFNKTEVNE